MKELVTRYRRYTGVERVTALRAAGHAPVGVATAYVDECEGSKDRSVLEESLRRIEN